MRLFRKAALTTAIASIALAAGTANATTMVGALGQFYHVSPTLTNFSIFDTLSALNTATQSGTFISTALNYGGNDGSTVASFLGKDGANYAGLDGPTALQDGIFVITGQLLVTGGVNTFRLHHDDAAQLTVGGQVVASGGNGLSDCCNDLFGSASFGSAGLVPFRLVYANTQYGGGQGQAYLTAYENNAVIEAAVPEPATWALMLLGFGMIGFAMRKRSNVRTTVSYA